MAGLLAFYVFRRETQNAAWVAHDPDRNDQAYTRPHADWRFHGGLTLRISALVV